jgi:hypothetical protein
MENQDRKPSQQDPNEKKHMGQPGQQNQQGQQQGQHGQQGKGPQSDKEKNWGADDEKSRKEA